MKLTLSTLSVPEWDLETLCSRASEYGYGDLDFRGYLDDIDITQCPEMSLLE